jgi:hypothetical protein
MFSEYDFKIDIKLFLSKTQLYKKERKECFSFETSRIINKFFLNLRVLKIKIFN